MNLRTLGIVTLIVLIAGLLWTLRPRGSQPAPVAPTPIVEKQVDAAPLESVATASPVRESAQSAAAPEVAPAIEAHTATDFALIKVLVLNKATRAPMPDVEVHGTYDTGARGHRIDQTKRSHGKPFEVLHTDAEGRVEIEMPPNVTSQVNASGRKQDAGIVNANIAALQPGAVREVLLELATGDDMTFWMKFVDETNHAPIAGVRVGAGPNGESKLTSDAQGLLLWQGRSWEPGILHYEADGYARAFLSPEPGHAESSTALVVSLPQSASLKLHVVDASGHALVGANIDLEAHGYDLALNVITNSVDRFNLADPHWRCVTDASGRGTITGLPPHIAIRAGVTSPRKWSAPEMLVLGPGETRELEWKLSNGCNVHGIVLDQSNAPVKQREMWLRTAERKTTAYFNSGASEDTRSARTDDQGRFHFEDVGVGTWSVGPSAPDYEAKVALDDVAAVAHIVEVADGQTDIDVTLCVDRGLFIRGEILNAKGEPAKGGNVSAYDQVQGLYTSTNMPSKDNSFAIGPLMAGHYALTARGLGGDADSDPVAVEAGASNVVLRLLAGSTLSGTVVGPSGDPVLAKIWVKMRSTKLQGVQGMNSMNDGTFRLNGLGAGTYDISAHTSDGATGLLEGVTVGSGESQTGLEIHLIPGGHVRVRHEGPDRYVNFSVLSHGVTVEIDGIERGASRDLASPVGTVTVQASYHEGDKRTVERTVDVKAGQTVDVVFEKDAH